MSSRAPTRMAVSGVGADRKRCTCASVRPGRPRAPTAHEQEEQAAAVAAGFREEDVRFAFGEDRAPMLVKKTTSDDSS